MKLELYNFDQLRVVPGIGTVAQGSVRARDTQLSSDSLILHGTSASFAQNAKQVADFLCSSNGIPSEGLRRKLSPFVDWFYGGIDSCAWITWHSQRFEGTPLDPSTANLGHRRTQVFSWLKSNQDTNLGYGLPEYRMPESFFFRDGWASPKLFRSVRRKNHDGPNFTVSVFGEKDNPEIVQTAAVPAVAEHYCPDSGFYSCPHVSLVKLDCDFHWALRALITLHPDNYQILGIKTNNQRFEDYMHIYVQDKLLLKRIRRGRHG